MKFTSNNTVDQVLQVFEKGGIEITSQTNGLQIEDRLWQEQEGATLEPNSSKTSKIAGLNELSVRVDENNASTLNIDSLLFQNIYYDSFGNILLKYDFSRELNNDLIPVTTQASKLELGDNLVLTQGVSGNPRLNARPTSGVIALDHQVGLHGLVSPNRIDVEVSGRSLIVNTTVILSNKGNNIDKALGSIVDVDTTLTDLTDNLKQYYFVFNPVSDSYTLISSGDISSAINTTILLQSYLISNTQIVLTNELTSQSNYLNNTYSSLNKGMPFFVSDIQLFYDDETNEFSLDGLGIKHTFMQDFTLNQTVSNVPQKYLFDDLTKEFVKIVSVAYTNFVCSCLFFVVSDLSIIEVFFEENSDHEQPQDAILIYKDVLKNQGQVLNCIIPVG